MATKEVVKATQAAVSAVSVSKKYTVQSTGIWERIRRLLAVAPNRSTGVPLNAQFRNPPPGTNRPGEYEAATTVPAADIAENPYFRRDVRRSYPQISFVSQADVVALLTVGSKAAPKEDKLLIGEAGTKQLVEVKRQGEEMGLANVFQKEKTSVASILGPGGLPPLPSGSYPTGPGQKRYEFSPEPSYPESLPCRSFV